MRLIGAYFVTINEIVKDDNGNIIELLATYEAGSNGKRITADGVKVKRNIHWVHGPSALTVEARIYDRLFKDPAPGKERDYLEDLNPNSLEVLTNVLVEPSLSDSSVGDRFQFMRNGYFAIDSDSTEDKLVFNRTISLRDTWGS